MNGRHHSISSVEPFDFWQHAWLSELKSATVPPKICRKQKMNPARLQTYVLGNPEARGRGPGARGHGILGRGRWVGGGPAGLYKVLSRAPVWVLVSQKSPP